MKTEILILFNVILLARLFFQFSETPLNWRRLLGLILVELIGLSCFQINSTWFSLTISLLLLNLLFFYFEQKQPNINLFRVISLAAFFLIGLIHSGNYFTLHLNQTLLSGLRGAAAHFAPAIPVGKLTPLNLHAILFGVLLLINEANQLIRLFFAWFDLKPQTAEAVPDNREYTAGRIIGILEREIIFIAVLTHQIPAIAYVLAAKGLARFKELDQRRYAEYFLIGTLLSSLIAVLLGMFIRFLF